MSQIIVALDTNNFEEIKKIIEQTEELITYYKVGLESYVSYGDKLLNYLIEKNKKIFLRSQVP